MSIKVMASVWADAPEDVKLGKLLVLLALADFAHDDGGGAYPAIPTLAAKARLTDRQTQRILRELESRGLVAREGESSWGTTIYRVILGGDNMSPADPQRVTLATESVSEMSPNPLKEPSVEDHSSKPTSEQGEGQPPTPPVPARPPAPDSTGRQWAPRLCLELASLMRRNDEKAKLPEPFRIAVEQGVSASQWPLPAPTGAKPWLDAARLLVDADERHPEEVLEVLRFSQDDDFWRTNVLSMPTLRKNYPKIRGAWVRSRQQASRGPAAVAAHGDSRAQAVALTRGYSIDDKTRRAGG